jgi:hypothetical protein
MPDGITVHQQIKVAPSTGTSTEGHLITRVAEAIKDIKQADGTPLPIFGIGGQNLDSGGALYLVVPDDMKSAVRDALTTRHLEPTFVEGNEVDAPYTAPDLWKIANENPDGFDIVVGPIPHAHPETEDGEHPPKLYVWKRSDSGGDPGEPAGG